MHVLQAYSVNNGSWPDIPRVRYDQLVLPYTTLPYPQPKPAISSTLSEHG